MNSKTNATRRWSGLAISLLFVGVAATSCGSDSGSSGPGNSSTTCSLAGNACEFGCSATLGCVQCETNANCDAGAPICVLGQCRACGASSDCNTGQVCSPATHQCGTPCTTNAECAPGQGNQNAPLCDTAAKVCVGCLSATDCPAATPICDATRRQCSQCSSRADCGVATPACNLQNGRCVECLVDVDCNGKGACGTDHQCHPVCKANADCTAPGAQGIAGQGNFCNTATGACVECLLATDCSADPATPVCSPTQHRCVACTTNAECPAATPICESTAAGQGGGLRGNRCVACQRNQDCTNPALPTCTAGVCVQ